MRAPRSDGVLQGRLLLLLVALLWLAVVATGCVPEDLPPPPGELEEFDMGVREQYEELRTAAETALAEGDAEEVASRLGWLGAWHHLYGFPDVALSLYERAARTAPEPARWHYYGGILLASRQEPAAADWFQRAIEADGESAAVRVRWAEVESEHGEVAEARRLFETALEAEPNSVRALVGLARLETDEGSVDRAVELAQRAVALQPSSSEVRYTLGMAYRKAGLVRQAEAQLAFTELDHQPDDLTMDDPWARDLWEKDASYTRNLQRAREAFRAGRLRSALEYFQRAAQSAPDSVGARQGVVSALLRLERWDTAWIEAESALEEFPQEPRFWFLAARACSQAIACGRDPEKLCERSLELDPSFDGAYLWLARHRTIEGDAAGALAMLRSARDAVPESEQVVLQLADHLVEAGRTAEALELLRSAQSTVESPWAIQLALRDLEAAER